MLHNIRNERQILRELKLEQIKNRSNINNIRFPDINNKSVETFQRNNYFSVKGQPQKTVRQTKNLTSTGIGSSFILNRSPSTSPTSPTSSQERLSPSKTLINKSGVRSERNSPNSRRNKSPLKQHQYKFLIESQTQQKAQKIKYESKNPLAKKQKQTTEIHQAYHQTKNTFFNTITAFKEKSRTKTPSFTRRTISPAITGRTISPIRSKTSQTMRSYTPKQFEAQKQSKIVYKSNNGYTEDMSVRGMNSLNKKTSSTNAQQSSNQSSNQSYTTNPSSNPAKTQTRNQDKNKTSPLKKAAQKIANPIYIDLSMCRYPILREVIQDLGWMQHHKRDDSFTIWWMDTACSTDRVMKMQDYQMINHFPGMNQIAKKISLTRNMRRMKREFPSHYRFFPQSWILPHDSGSFNRNKKIEGKTFIIKPNSGCQGKGIILTKDKAQAENMGDAIVQLYVEKPYLIDGFKFDLRVYVLVLSVEPLTVYVYNEGLVRMCTAPYQAPTYRNLRNEFMHLSNYAINKKNVNFEAGTNFNTGSKRNFGFLNAHLKAEGNDVDKIWKKIYGVINKTLIAIQPSLAKSYKNCMTNSKNSRWHCFEVLGFDILLDHKLNPWLLEVNHAPSFNTDTPLDRFVKKDLIKETCQLLVFHPEHRIQSLKRQRAATKERVTGEMDYSTYHPTPSNDLLHDIHISNERRYLKNYVKIFPTSYFSDRYEPLLQKAQEISDKLDKHSTNFYRLDHSKYRQAPRSAPSNTVNLTRLIPTHKSQIKTTSPPKKPSTARSLNMNGKKLVIRSTRTSAIRERNSRAPRRLVREKREKERRMQSISELVEESNQLMNRFSRLVNRNPVHSSLKRKLR